MGYWLKIVEVKLNLKVPICRANSNGIFECQSSNTSYRLKLPKSSKFEGHNCQDSSIAINYLRGLRSTLLLNRLS
jgi:hypothetical protein